jgi:hypothetical protein
VSELIDYFDRSYIINLPERRDRREEMLGELERLGATVDGERLQFFAAVKSQETHGFPSLGAYGCFMSHLGVLRDAREAGASSVLIMEDDLSVSRFLATHQGAVVRRLQETPWDIVYLGHTVSAKQQGELHLEPYHDAIIGSHFIAVRGHALDRVIAFFELVRSRPGGHPEGGPMHVDGAYSTFRQQNPDLAHMIVVPSLGGQRSSPSDIAGRKWFDRTPGLRRLARLARKLRQRRRRG